MADNNSESNNATYSTEAMPLMKPQAPNNLRADVCKYRPGVGKIKISKNPKKIQWTTLGTLFMKI